MLDYFDSLQLSWDTVFWTTAYQCQLFSLESSDQWLRLEKLYIWSCEGRSHIIYIKEDCPLDISVFLLITYSLICFISKGFLILFIDIIRFVFQTFILCWSSNLRFVKYLQSLHTAVQGPDGSALEVQIRTQVFYVVPMLFFFFWRRWFQSFMMSKLCSIFQKMHEYAEHGLAAHWLYKETGNKLQSISSMDESDIEASSSLSKDMDDHNPLDTDLFQKYSSLKMGHPVIRVEGSNLLAAVIIRFVIYF